MHFHALPACKTPFLNISDNFLITFQFFPFTTPRQPHQHPTITSVFLPWPWPHPDLPDQGHGGLMESLQGAVRLAAPRNTAHAQRLEPSGRARAERLRLDRADHGRPGIAPKRGQCRGEGMGGNKSCLEG